MRISRLVCVLLVFSTLWMASALLGDTATTTTTSTAPCLQQVGDPYVDGDKVCVKVKNTCAHIVAVDWTVGTHDFGVQGTPIDSESGTLAIDPGKTATICKKKPATAGDYCFRFDVRNRDQGQPDDKFIRWRNNVEVAMFGGQATGQFAVGGSAFLQEDVVLAVTSPPGWALDLSTTFVAAADFPATVDFTLFGPDGEPAEIVVTAFGAISGDWVGDATLRVGDDDAEPTDPEEPDQDEEPVVPLHLRPQFGAQVETNPASLAVAGSVDGETVTETGLLIAWAEAITDPRPEALFEVKVDGAWRSIARQAGLSSHSLGVASVVWDTTALPAGPYRVRVTLSDRGEGRVAQAERVVQVAKRPTARFDARISSSADSIVLDGSRSVDPDGAIREWRWTFADGSQALGVTTSRTREELRRGPVTLTVIDAQGFETVEVCEVEVPAPGGDGDGEPGDGGDPGDGEVPVECEVEDKTCGCESMEIKGAGTNSGIPFPGSVGGGTANGPRKPSWAGGPAGSNSMVYRFEVLAKLDAGSDPSLCTFAQYAKGTYTVGAATGHKEEDGVDYPLAGDTYGDDTPFPDYSDSDATATPPTINWIDAPGFHTLPSPHDGTARSFNAKFYAIVSGPAGTCSCSWEVNMSLSAAGAVTGPSLDNVNCS